MEVLTSKYRSESRWNKAIQHLAEEGRLDNSMRDMPALIAEVKRDTMEECRDEIKEDLFKWAEPKLQRGLVRGLPDWYKYKLAERISE